MEDPAKVVLKEVPNWYQNLVSSFDELLREESLLDLTFLCLKDGGEVRVHKTMLINCRYVSSNSSRK